MGRDSPTRDEILEAIKRLAAERGAPPSRAAFIAASGIGEYHVLRWFSAWTEAVRAAGLQPDESNVRLSDEALLSDWADYVRKHRSIPTRAAYRRAGSYSPGVFDSHFGPWSTIPSRFRSFAEGKSEWADVVALLPPPVQSVAATGVTVTTDVADVRTRYSKLDGRPTYGDPIDFRGLRHAPVNEQGVVFLFGVVARELGYMVEAVQTGFPDCEAKRQVATGQWQRVRIEFEYESRNFRDHGHDPEGCDLIVCWHHNWTECPPNLEVVELESVIRSLSRED